MGEGDGVKKEHVKIPEARDSRTFVQEPVRNYASLEFREPQRPEEVGRA